MIRAYAAHEPGGELKPFEYELEQLDGKTVDWMEKVSYEQYQSPKVNK